MKNIAQKEERKQLKIKTEKNERGVTVHAGLFPVLTFIWSNYYSENEYKKQYVRTYYEAENPEGYCGTDGNNL